MIVSWSATDILAGKAAVQVPTELDVSPLLAIAPETRQAMSLMAVFFLVDGTGGKDSGAHWTCSVYDRHSGLWYFFDDHREPVCRGPVLDLSVNERRCVAAAVYATAADDGPMWATNLVRARSALPLEHEQAAPLSPVPCRMFYATSEWR